MQPRAWLLALLAVTVLSCREDSEKNGEAEGTLLLLRERPFSELLSPDDEYEASGVAIVGDTLRVVFDNRTQVAEVDLSLTTARLGPGRKQRSDYEAITIATRPAPKIYIAKEVGAGGRAAIVEVDMEGRLLSTEPTDLVVDDDTKGLEGIAWLDDVERLLALCEAGSCRGGGQSHGVINALRHEGSEWITETTLTLPGPAAFDDYSDLAVRREAEGIYRIAVLSQESSAVWLGTLTTNPLAFAGEGAVYRFPLAQGGRERCALEGVSFVDPTTIAVVSDRRKKSARCSEGQAVHVFALP